MQGVQLSAALSHHVGGRWPGAESGQNRAVPALTNKSAAPPLMRSELIQLRIRTVFGVDARADLLSAMLDLKSEFGASDFRYLGYTKRNVATDLNALQSGGILARATRGNQHLFRWKRRDEFAALVAPVPAGFPLWLPLVRLATALVRLSSDLETKSSRLARVAAANHLGGMTPDLEALRLTPPQEGGPIYLELLESREEPKTCDSELRAIWRAVWSPSNYPVGRFSDRSLSNTYWGKCEWRARQDSNLRPTDSKSVALSS